MNHSCCDVEVPGDCIGGWPQESSRQAGTDTVRERRCLHPQHCRHHGQGAAQRGGPPPTPGDLRPPPARRDQRPHQRAAQHRYVHRACSTAAWFICLRSTFRRAWSNCNCTDSILCVSSPYLIPFFYHVFF